uniref:Uncharacterized protein n=1 Tax=Oryza punctata TaxID=4537 RepID=A0A0E0KCY6_ORYPU
MAMPGPAGHTQPRPMLPVVLLCRHFVRIQIFLHDAFQSSKDRFEGIQAPERSYGQPPPPPAAAATSRRGPDSGESEQCVLTPASWIGTRKVLGRNYLKQGFENIFHVSSKWVVGVNVPLLFAACGRACIRAACLLPGCHTSLSSSTQKTISLRVQGISGGAAQRGPELILRGKLGEEAVASSSQPTRLFNSSFFFFLLALLPSI